LAAAPVASQSYQPTTSDRYVRLCPEHGTHLDIEHRDLARGGSVDQLICPRGHDVNRWASYDRKTFRVIGYGTPDQITVILGECDDVVEGPRHEQRRRVHRARKWDR